MSITKNIQEFERIADDFSLLPLYFMSYRGQESIKNVLQAMAHAVYVHDISHVIVDNLQFMMGIDYNENNRFIRQDHIVSSFRNFATEKNCHVTLIIHPKKVNEGEELSASSIFGSAKVSQEADNILLIQDFCFNKPSGRKYLQIAKNRFDGDLGVVMLTFNKDSNGFTLADKKKKKKQEEELSQPSSYM